MSKDLVFFDSNMLYTNDDVNQILPIEELKKYLHTGTIYFPDMVFEEVKQKKRESLKKLSDSLFGNKLFKSFNPSWSFDIEEYINTLITIIDIEYIIVFLNNNEKLLEIKQMAIEKKPPFEGKNKESDKGFKDVYIYFTILEFLEKEQKQIYFIAKDELVKEAFKDNPLVSIHDSYDNYINSRLSYYGDEYFLEQLSLELDDKILSKHIKNKYITPLNTVQLYIEKDTKKINVFCDYTTRELLEYESLDKSIENKVNGIESLRNSTSFEKTHDAIEQLSKYSDYTNEQEEELINIFLNNRQVFWIATDEDVEKFFSFATKKKSYMNDEKWKEFKKHF